MKLHFFGLCSLFCLFLLLSLLKETLLAESRTWPNPHACFFEDVSPSSLLEEPKHLLMSGVICLELMSCCSKQMTFSLIGAITIATSRHKGCLANPKINKWILCKWSLGIAVWPLVSVVGDSEAMPAAEGSFFFFFFISINCLCFSQRNVWLGEENENIVPFSACTNSHGALSKRKGAFCSWKTLKRT